MQYVLSSADEDRVEAWTGRLRRRGYEVLEEYPGGDGDTGDGGGADADTDDVIVVSLGGDGSVLYNARRYPDPTILPVATGDSEANTAQVRESDLVGRIQAIEEGEAGGVYRVVEHHKVRALSDGAPIRGGFEALNDVHLHHASPVRAAKFRVRVLADGGGTDAGGDGDADLADGEGGDADPVDGDGGDGTDGDADADGDPADADADADGDDRPRLVPEAAAGPDGAGPDAGGPDDGGRPVYATPEAIGDGLLVATPFGSTGYYRSITGGTIETGLGVAFNNVHKPREAPTSVVVGPEGRVELELLGTRRSSSAVLVRDEDPDPYEVRVGETVAIERSPNTVGIVRFPRGWV